MNSIYRKWLQQGTYSLLNRIAIVAFGFINLLFLVRVLPKHEVGIWMLFTSVAAIVETARNGFIRNPVLAHLSGASSSEEKKIISASFILHFLTGLGISVLALAIGAPLARFWRVDGLQQLFDIYAVTSLVLVVFLQFEYLMQWKLYFRGIFISNAIRMGLFSVFLAAFFFSGYRPGLIELAYMQLFITVAGVFISYRLMNKEPLKGLSLKSGRMGIHSLFHMGKYTIGTNISSMVIKNTDSWMIGRMITSAAVAVYNPAIRIANIVEVPTLAIASLIFPHVNKKMTESGEEGVRNLYIKSVSLILAIIVPSMIFIYFFAEPLILFVFGEDYLDTAVILQVTILYMLIVPFNRQFGTVMDGLKKPKLNFFLIIGVAILNVLFSYLFIRGYGVLGAAYGTLLAYCVVFVFNQAILYRLYKISTLDVFLMIPYWYGFGLRMLRQQLLSR